MNAAKTFLFGALIFLLSALGASAQTSPNFTYGFVPTPAQWNSYFAGKQDYLGASPCLVTGCTLSGELFTVASSIGSAGLNVSPGVAPTSPLNGDIWTTTAGLFVRINGATIGPLTAVSSGLINQLAWYASSGNVLSGLATANNGVLVTSAGGVPSISSTLPASLTIPTPVINGIVSGTGVSVATFGNTLVLRDGSGNIFGNSATFSASLLVGQSLSIGGTAITLGNTSGSTVLAIGQDSTHYLTANWVFNATPASANAQIATAGFANPITIDGSNVSIQGLSGGTLSLLGRTVALGGNLSTAAALTHAGAFATTITATAITNSTLPAGTHTLAGLDVAQTWSANQSFNSGNLLLNGSGSGASTLNAPATGGGTATLFAGTDTVVGVAAVQTLTGKTLQATSNIIGGVSMSLGSDGTGDIYYRNSGGILTRLGIGSSTNVLTVSGGIPAWSTAGLTVGTSAIASGTTTRILFDNAGVLGEYTLTGTGTTVAMSAGPTFTGTVVAPIHAGGTAAGSNLVLQSTSGAGTTDFIALQTASQSERMRIATGGNVGVGTNNPQAILHINSNTTQNVANIIAGIQISLVDAGTGGIQINTFGSGNPQISMLASTGTAASKTATQSGNFLFILDAEGYSGSVYSGQGLWASVAAENWGSTNRGSYAVVHTTPIGSTTRTEAIRIQASGGLSIGTTTDPGIGSLQLNAQAFMPNITTSSAAQTGTMCWTTGTGKFTVDTTAGCLTSVREAKDIISRPASVDALHIVDQLSPISFRYKNGWGDSGRAEQFGLVADEVAAVDERLAGRDPQGKLQGVRYQELTAVLIGAIQQLKADNDNLKQSIEKLRNRKR